MGAESSVPPSCARGTVEVELYGLPRLYAGGECCRVAAGTLSEVLAALVVLYPGLSPALINGAMPTDLLRVALDGGEMIEASDHVLCAGSVLVLVSAQAGG